MNKLIEIEGKLIQVLSKTIEINGNSVTTQGEIKVLFDMNAPLNELEKLSINSSIKETTDIDG